MELPSIYGFFGPRLAKARRAADLTQAELARQVGLSRASVANIEAGNQRVFLDQVFQFAQALGQKSIAEFFEDLPLSEQSPANGLVVTGARRLSRQQEQMLAKILAEVGGSE